MKYCSLLIVVLVLAGCAKPTTATAPAPAQSAPVPENTTMTREQPKPTTEKMQPRVGKGTTFRSELDYRGTTRTEAPTDATPHPNDGPVKTPSDASRD